MLLPLKPLLASRISAVALLCSASAEFRKGFEVVVFEVVDALLELVVLDVDEELDDEDELDDALEELPDVDCGLVGWKKLLPAPNPILRALGPPTDMDAAGSFAVITSLPLVSSQAVTCAFP
jgi:hypothetical protein